jgi:putative phosphoribosyl transferase
MPPRPPFADRTDAGKQLAAALPTLAPDGTVVVALPRGGVPVAEEICKAYHLPLDLVFVRKIGVPGQPEVAIGAIVDGENPKVVINEKIASHAGVTAARIEEMGHALVPEIERRRALYFQGRQRPELKGKTIVVVDDGVATGATLRASLLGLRQSRAARIIVALPTAPSDVLPSFEGAADQIICLHQQSPFWSVGAAYRHFPQTSDAEVIHALQRCAGFMADRGEG